MADSVNEKWKQSKLWRGEVISLEIVTVYNSSRIIQLQRQFVDASTDRAVIWPRQYNYRYNVYILYYWDLFVSNYELCEVSNRAFIIGNELFNYLVWRNCWIPSTNLESTSTNSDWKNRDPGSKFPPKVQLESLVLTANRLDVLHCFQKFQNSNLQESSWKVCESKNACNRVGRAPIFFPRDPLLPRYMLWHVCPSVRPSMTPALILPARFWSL